MHEQHCYPPKYFIVSHWYSIEFVIGGTHTLADEIKDAYIMAWLGGIGCTHVQGVPKLPVSPHLAPTTT